MKFSKQMRKHKIDCLEKWIKTINDRVDSRYSLNKLAGNGIDIYKVIESLTSDQLQAFISLTSASYTNGCGTTRDHIYSLKHEGRSREIPSGWTVLEGGRETA